MVQKACMSKLMQRGNVKHDNQNKQQHRILWISNQSYNCVQAVWTNPFCFLFLYSEKKTEKFISTPVNNCWPGDHTTLLQFKSDNHIIVYDCPGFKFPSVQINLEALFRNR